MITFEGIGVLDGCELLVSGHNPNQLNGMLMRYSRSTEVYRGVMLEFARPSKSWLWHDFILLSVM